MFRTLVACFTLAFSTLCLAACGEPGEEIPDSRGPDAMTQPDSGHNTDAGVDSPDAPQQDVCLQQGPPPQGVYVMSGTGMLCGENPQPGNHGSWDFVGGPSAGWACQLDIHPDPETGSVCIVLCPGHFGADYNAITVERAGAVGPYRFYYTPPGSSSELVCYDPRTLPAQSKAVKEMIKAVEAMVEALE